ncbi:LuxR C-terminal-related transcriptional regulator [Hymenobacter sp. DH14]|uniref:LuxR C-terminal-related transcriptional regulator n=1 Tax=Hymenobacter cyanobacteriorum TaxID=2926463 RepID=A0A9X1VCX6_9BACT|nr:LuxR C-terminal-related transcriptional regulator [Hymenobacter cyanobacteriorum]MCI1186824.1 LuxR C-terminal-related transcriptional regulator [Hymenobacter cyanobacteriorum]
MSLPESQPLLVPPTRQHSPTNSQQRQIAAAVAEVAHRADLHPGVTIIANLLLDRVEYMSQRGLQELHTTQEDIRALGSGYWAEYFNPADAEDYLPKVFEMIQNPDPWAVTSVFQQVRIGPGRSYVWHLSATRVLLRDEDTGQPLLLVTTSIPVDPIHHVTHKVSRLLAENNFLRQHNVRFGRLTRREREVLRLLALGHSAPEIAEQLFIPAQTAETHRRNVRQKLGVATAFELSEYARAFDLI